MTILAATIIAPSLPKIQQGFQADVDITFAVTLVLTITSFFIALVSPLAGALSDKFGRRPVLLISLFLYGLSGTAGLYVNDVYPLIVSRVFLGTAIAGVMTSVTSLIADLFEGEEREKFLGWQATFIALGGFLFLSLGGILATINWRLPFGIYFLSWILLPFAYFWIEEPECHKVEGPPPSEHYPLAHYGMILVVAMIAMIIYYFLPTKLPFYFGNRLHFEPFETGFFLSASVLSVAFSSSVYQYLHRVFSKPLLYFFTFLLIGVGMSLFAQVETIPFMLLAVCLIGLGFGLVIPNSTVWVTEIAPPKIRGRMVGGLTSCLFIGQFFSSLVGDPITRAFGYTGTFGLYGLAGLFSLILSAILLSCIAVYKRWRPQQL